MGLRASVIDEEEFGLMMSSLTALVFLVFDMTCMLAEMSHLQSRITRTTFLIISDLELRGKV